MEKIGHIRITVEPWNFDNKYSEIHIEVSKNMNIFSYVKPMVINDLESVFDVLFLEAKRSLKNEILGGTKCQEK